MASSPASAANVRGVITGLGTVALGSFIAGFVISLSRGVVQPFGPVTDVRILLTLQGLTIILFLTAMLVSMFAHAGSFSTGYQRRYLLLDITLSALLVTACLFAPFDVWIFRITEVFSGVIWLLRVYLTSRDPSANLEQRETLAQARDAYFPYVVAIIGLMAVPTPLRAALPALSTIELVPLAPVGIDGLVSDLAFTMLPFLLSVVAASRIRIGDGPSDTPGERPSG